MRSELNERLSPARFAAALRAAGLTPAGAAAVGSLGRAEDAKVRPARLVGEGVLTAVPVGAASACPHPLAFLDGTQRHRLAAYAGSAPLVLGTVAAAIRLRTAGELRTVASARAHLAIGRPEVLDAAGAAIAGYERALLPSEEPLHPALDLDRARAALDERRGQLEVALGDAFRDGPDGSHAWLIVDGSLAESPRWSADPRMIGVSKSHATLPFEGRDLETYLRLPAGCRSSVFQPASRRVAPVYSWGLRLWPWEGKDLFHGLVRVEAAPTEETLARVDEWSRWLLAERSPLSTPDARWDRMLYGIRSVEQYLEASGER